MGIGLIRATTMKDHSCNREGYKDGVKGGVFVVIMIM